MARSSSRFTKCRKRSCPLQSLNIEHPSLRSTYLRVAKSRRVRLPPIQPMRDSRKDNPANESASVMDPQKRRSWKRMSVDDLPKISRYGLVLYPPVFRRDLLIHEPAEAPSRECAG